MRSSPNGCMASARWSSPSASSLPLNSSSDSVSIIEPRSSSHSHSRSRDHALERADFTLADIPKEWEAFWSFWCDDVQPAVRKAMGRDDVWGIGLPMSAMAPNDTRFVFMEFVHALG